MKDVRINAFKKYLLAKCLEAKKTENHWYKRSDYYHKQSIIQTNIYNEIKNKFYELFEEKENND